MERKTALRCPNCGETFTVNESEYNAILQQVHTSEFDSEVSSRVAEIKAHMDKNHSLEVDKSVNKALSELRTKHEEEVALLSEKREKETAELRGRLDEANRTLDIARNKFHKLNAQIESAERDKENAVLKATGELKDAMNNQRVEYDRKIAALTATSETEKEKLRIALEAAEKQTEYYKDFKMKQSTKLLGESLEKHCEISFEKERMRAFPNAEFGKDNDVSTGSKGDYVFREKDPDSGVEIVSIMFEMKNETDTTVTKHKNEDFYAELDKDRREKNCEYAVLVSMLEQDNEFFNEGIVSVSHKYPKMYVVRPQNFIAIISLLRHAAYGALEYKKELAVVRAQNIDISNFEDALMEFKSDFMKNVENAGKRFDDAVKGIDKTIDYLQKIKESLVMSNKHLIAANNKVEKVTVKKLTKNNPTIMAMIEEAREKEKLDESA